MRMIIPRIIPIVNPAIAPSASDNPLFTGVGDSDVMRIVAMASVVTSVLVVSVLVVSAVSVLVVTNCKAIEVEASLEVDNEMKPSLEDEMKRSTLEVKRLPLEEVREASLEDAVEVGMITLVEVIWLVMGVGVDGCGIALLATMKALLNKGIDEEDIMDDVTMTPQLGSVQLHSGP